MFDTCACKIINNEESTILYKREREREIFSPVILVRSIIIWTSSRIHARFRSNLSVAHAGERLPIMTDIPFDVEGDTIAHGDRRPCRRFIKLEMRRAWWDYLRPARDWIRQCVWFSTRTAPIRFDFGLSTPFDFSEPDLSTSNVKVEPTNDLNKRRLTRIFFIPSTFN